MKNSRILRLSLLTLIVVQTFLLPASAAVARPVAAPPPIGFERFPIDTPQTIEFDLPEDAFAGMTARERREQVLDWILFGLVAEAGLSAEEVGQVLYDVPALRSGFLQPMANFEFGATRSAYLGDGRVLALVPAAEAADRQADLGQIVDKARMNQGASPDSVLVFEYELDPATPRARVTQQQAIAGDALYQTAAGYIEMLVTEAADLATLLSEIDTLTVARATPTGLLLGGRRYAGDWNRSIGLNVEDVAALWQAEAARQASLYGGGDAVVLEGAGFSLDPVYDFAGLTAYLDEITPDLQWLAGDLDDAAQERLCVLVSYYLLRDSGQIDPNRLEPTYNSMLLAWQEFGFFPESDQTFCDLVTEIFQYNGFIANELVIETVPPLTTEDIVVARQGLLDEDVQPYLLLMEKLAASPAPMIQILGNEWFSQGEANRFQAARYNGDLQGTEAAMVLFYTDLLAKLWALNYQDSATEVPIEDFTAMTRVSLSPIYAAELDKLSRTRLWFGPRNRGFQLAEGGDTLFFDRTATRVYAASATAFRPGEEGEANAQSAAFLGWWNDHYEDVAEYEPAYQRLNEIMKWSLIVSWLYHDEREAQLAFLIDVDVTRNRWFPDWIKSNPDLTFQAWDAIEFFPPSYTGTTTEALPVLTSEPYSLFGQEHLLSGGVSLAPTILFEELAPLNNAVPEHARRAALDYASASVSGAEQQFVSQDGVEYAIDPATDWSATVSAVAPANAKRRGPNTEVLTPETRSVLAVTADGLSTTLYITGESFATLSSKRTSDGLRIAMAPRIVDVAQQLALRMSRASDPLKVLEQARSVEAIWQIDTNQYLTKIAGAEPWLHYAVNLEAEAPAIGPWTFQSAELDASSSVVTYGWVDDATVLEYLVAQEWVGLETTDGSRQLQLQPVMIRGPPDQSQSQRIPIDVDNSIEVYSSDQPGQIWIDAKSFSALSARTNLPVAELLRSAAYRPAIETALAAFAQFERGGLETAASIANTTQFQQGANAELRALLARQAAHFEASGMLEDHSASRLMAYYDNFLAPERSEFRTNVEKTGDYLSLIARAKRFLQLEPTSASRIAPSDALYLPDLSISPESAVIFTLASQQGIFFNSENVQQFNSDNAQQLGTFYRIADAPLIARYQPDRLILPDGTSYVLRDAVGSPIGDGLRPAPNRYLFRQDGGGGQEVLPPVYIWIPGSPSVSPATPTPQPLAPAAEPPSDPVPAATPMPLPTVSPTSTSAAAASRPQTGLLDRAQGDGGAGEFTIENQQDEDTIVAVVDLDERPLAIAYLRHGEAITITDIPDGAYLVYLATGTGWNAVRQTFAENARYERLDEPFGFETTATQYTGWTLTLSTAQSVGNGSASTDIDPSEFPTMR